MFLFVQSVGRRILVSSQGGGETNKQERKQSKAKPEYSPTAGGQGIEAVDHIMVIISTKSKALYVVNSAAD